MKRYFFIPASFLVLVSGMFISGNVLAASSAVPLAKVDIELNQEAYRRGAKVAIETCNLCHELKYIRYRNLLDIGFTQQEVDSFRGNKSMEEVLAASMTPPLAKKAFGMIPPDLSLMAKARKKGDRYIYTLMNSYHEVADNQYDNKLFPGIRMPDVFAVSVETDEKRRAMQEQQIKDVTSFLVWASDPHADTRRTMGMYVIAYLVLLTFLLFLWKRKVWSRLDD